MVNGKSIPKRRPGAHLFRSPRRRQRCQLSEKYLNFSSYFFRSDTDIRYGKKSDSVHFRYTIRYIETSLVSPSEESTFAYAPSRINYILTGNRTFLSPEG